MPSSDGCLPSRAVQTLLDWSEIGHLRGRPASQPAIGVRDRRGLRLGQMGEQSGSEIVHRLLAAGEDGHKAAAQVPLSG